MHSLYLMADISIAVQCRQIGMEVEYVSLTLHLGRRYLKFVIHTDGICDVYNVPSANMASSEIRDTPNMSVVFQSMEFGNDNDNLEYLFVNDFGNLDDLTLANFMQLVSVPIRTSPVYDVSDNNVAPVQAPDHLLLPLIYH